MAKKNHPYKGALAKPIRVQTPKKPVLSLLAEDSEWAEAMRLHKIAVLENRLKARVEMLAKLPLLLEHYGLQNESNEMKWLSLVMKLAEDCVPGFKIEERKTIGRKKSWTDHELLKIYYAVRDKIEGKSRKITVREACISLAKQEPWKGKLTAKALQHQYIAAAKSNIVKICELIMSGMVKKNGMELHEAMIRRKAIDALLNENVSLE
jgi:hypothetical protein